MRPVPAEDAVAGFELDTEVLGGLPVIEAFIDRLGLESLRPPEVGRG